MVSFSRAFEVSRIFCDSFETSQNVSGTPGVDNMSDDVFKIFSGGVLGAGGEEENEKCGSTKVAAEVKEEGGGEE